jgi:hypothetical protein
MRASVGSSADILLTPIRGSTALSDDDFVLLPSSHALENGSPDDIAPPPSERCESPGPTILTLLTESEAHHTVAHESHFVEHAALEEQRPEPEPENSITPLSRSLTPETRTIISTIVEVHSEAITETPAVPSVSQTIKVTKQPPVHNIVVVPVSSGSKVAKPLAVSPSPPTKPPVLVVEHQRNIIPFPSDREDARHTAPTRVESIMKTEPLELYQNSSVTWVVSVWRTASGIMLLAAECYRWLARKGLRDDFRSCISYWFLKELVIGFVLPLCLAPVALWLLFRTMHLHPDSSSISL